MHEDELTHLGPLAGTLGTGARVYHVGFVVPDLDDAIAVLGPVLGVTFAPAVDLPFTTLETPDGPRDVRLRLAYSTRPAHVELIATAPGTLWDFDDQRRGHHLGVWTDDIGGAGPVGGLRRPAARPPPRRGARRHGGGGEPPRRPRHAALVVGPRSRRPARVQLPRHPVRLLHRARERRVPTRARRVVPSGRP